VADVSLVNVFAAAEGGGNPTPIVLDASGYDEARMLQVTRSFGLESAFVFPPTDPGRADFCLRFFVPRQEMNMCGHATLGTFWPLRRVGKFRGSQARVETGSGLVRGLVQELGAPGEYVEITQPAGRLQARARREPFPDFRLTCDPRPGYVPALQFGPGRPLDAVTGPWRRRGRAFRMDVMGPSATRRREERTMTHRGRTTRVFAMGFVAAVFVASGSVVAWAKTEFRLSNQLPPSHHISKGLVLFAEKVKEYSKGAVEVKIFDSAQLYKDTEIVEALQEGLIETGLVPVNKWSGMISAADVFEMPFIYKDLTSIKKFIDAGAGDLLDKEFQKRSVKTLFWVDYGYIQFFNNKHPLTKPDDFKGL
jgi:hypothetical protein